ncbi:MAG: tRNA pseudouridine(38-40) synthase TruA [Anaerolineae bacterium]|nr:tRNA pseudouridine(38-40) synthase TruA [Anaerolineae bacterium]
MTGPVRYRAVVAYDGTHYCGFQRQAGDRPTIQGAIEAALQAVTGEHVNITGAGRTDAGVHAHHQVIAWQVAWRHGVEDLQRALNANLPQDIALQAVSTVHADFHPRFDAVSRTYQYQIYNAAVRHPLYARTAWHVVRPLDMAAMQAAAHHLEGTHDFAAFGRPTHPASDNTVRTVYRARWERRGAQLTFTIEANAFLQRMVRSIAGSLVKVGGGSLSPEAFADILAAADRARAGDTAPPHGLSLINVKYAE